MAVLKEGDKRQVRQRLSAMERGVRLVVFTQEMECLFWEHTRELIEEVGELSEKITVEVHDFVKAEELGIDKIPAVAILGTDGSDPGIRFYGIP